MISSTDNRPRFGIYDFGRFIVVMFGDEPFDRKRLPDYFHEGSDLILHEGENGGWYELDTTKGTNKFQVVKDMAHAKFSFDRSINEMMERIYKPTT